MHAEDLNTLLSRNCIDQQLFEDDLYNTMLLSIFSVLIEEMQSAGEELEVLAKFRKNRDELFVTRSLVSRYVGCELSNEEYIKIHDLLIAHFNKKTTRKNWDISVREKLLITQDHKCAICNCHIEMSSAELDHIIPWAYVGDELNNNLQMLCETCNRKKSKSIMFSLLMSFYSRQ